jgi:hypothetical protein
MDEREWWKSIAPDVTYCLGQRLRPFSPGHWVLLKRLNSPFLTGDPITYADLMDAVYVCARTFKRGYHGLNSRLYQARGVLRNFWWKRLGIRSLDAATATAVMRVHIANGLRWPILMPNATNDKGADCASPMLQCLIVHLTSKLHQDAEKVLDWPLGFCFRLYATAAEMTGCARLTDEQGDADLDARANEVQARLKVKFS